MCGIAGIYSCCNREKTWSSACLDQMLDGIAHRGPDGVGKHLEPGLFMGHTRLAVIDLSSAGHQPKFSRDKRLLITFNGEIYNFRELRADLENCGHNFVTKTDTEVLLAAWSEWGEGALARLDGIFAFALYDRVEQALFLVRDHLGVKPLFYQLHDSSLFFSSELLALFSACNPCPAAELEDLDTYFTFNYLPAPRTGLQAVKQLPPGSLLRADSSGTTLRRYWSPEYKPDLTLLNADSVERFRKLLFTAVKRETISDVPLGLFLSGGLDSYAVALATVSGGNLPSAFTLGFADPEFDETIAATESAQFLGISDHSVRFVYDDYSVERTLGAMNELLADASCFPLYQLSAFARQKVTVILSGDGADELLAGYETYRADALTPMIRALPTSIRNSLRSLIGYLPAGNKRYSNRMVAERLLDSAEAGPRRDHATFRRIFSDEVKRRLYCPDFLEAVAANDPVGEYAALMAQVPAGRSYLTACQHADLLFHLPAILAKVDRMSMAHALEVRVPLLSRQMVEFCLNLDDAAKRTMMGGKKILRRAFGNDIPPSALQRPKAGFLPPVDKWFSTPGPISTIFGDYLVTARNSLHTLRWDEVERYWQEHRQGRVMGGFALLSILQYINWSMKCRN